MTPLLALLLSAAPEPDARLLTQELTAGVGVLGASYTAVGARLGDAFVMPTLTARGVFGGFVVEAGVSGTSPVTPARASFGVNGLARIGWSGARWSVVGGVFGQFAPEAKPTTLLLPSLRGEVSFGTVGLSLGVFDHLGLVPAHLSVELGPWSRGRFSLGWVAPLGLLATGSLTLIPGVDVRVTAFAFKLANTETAMVLVSGVLRGAR